jgi:hypothetical protein
METNPDVNRDLLCDMNPARLPNGQLQSHLAYDEFGNAPTVCGRCFVIVCRTCSDPDYDTEASLGSTPKNTNQDFDDDMPDITSFRPKDNHDNNDNDKGDNDKSYKGKGKERDYDDNDPV